MRIATVAAFRNMVFMTIHVATPRKMLEEKFQAMLKCDVCGSTHKLEFFQSKLYGETFEMVLCRRCIDILLEISELLEKTLQTSF
ncbi:MAG: hypothetical protein U9O89_02580 [Thermoproteota archaeon]|nr:hypothetical protein [Thermoproteota archaeon]